MPRAKAQEVGVADLLAELQDQPVSDEFGDESVPDDAPGPDPTSPTEPAQPTAPTPPSAPAPTIPAEPSAQELLIKQLEDQLARARGKQDLEPVYDTAADLGSGETVVIHFLENGFTALGQIWYRGQEIEFVPGSRAYKDTFDRHGQSWLDLRHDEFRQVEKYGEIMFRSGPWPGKTYTDGAGSPLDFQLKPVRSGDRPIMPPTQDELHAAAQAEARRARRAPRLAA